MADLVLEELGVLELLVGIVDLAVLLWVVFESPVPWTEKTQQLNQTQP